MKRMLVLLLGVAVLLCALVGSAQEGKPLGKVPSDLALVPADASGFVTFRTADLVKAQPLLSLLTGGSGPLEELTQMTGLAPASLERLTMVLHDFDAMPVLVIRTRQPYDKAALLKKLGAHKEAQLGGKTVYRLERRGLPAAWLADASTIVMAGDREMGHYLARLTGGGKAHPLADELAVADKHSVVVGLRPSLLLQRADALRQALRHERKKDAIKPKDFPRDEKKPDVQEGRFEPISLARGGQKGGKGVQEPKLRDVEAILNDNEGTIGFSWVGIVGKPFLRARRALLTADFGAELRGTLRVEYADPDHARDGELFVRLGLYVARELAPVALREAGLDPKSKPTAVIIAKLQAATRTAEVQRDGKVVQASARAKLEMNADVVKFLAERQLITRDANNLKLIGLAFHHYHDTHGYFPPAAVRSADGKPLLSWRVAILPYIEQQGLYRQFRLNEPWDSPHNKKLLGKMPKVYAPVAGAAPDPGSTFYQVFTGPNTLYARPRDRQRFANVTDGLSNTLLVVEASRAVPWTKPDDIAIVPKQALPKLGGQFARFFHALMGDGSVRQVRRNVDDKILRQWISPNGGEVTDDKDLKP